MSGRASSIDPATRSQRPPDRVAPLERRQHPRVHIGPPGHRGGVAQLLGDRAHHGLLGPRAGGLRLRPLVPGDDHRGQHGRVPGAEVLRGELVADMLLQPPVDVVGPDLADRLPFAVRQKPVVVGRDRGAVPSRAPRAGRRGCAACGRRRPWRRSRTGARPWPPDVTAQQRRHSPALLRVLVAAGAEDAAVEHPQRARQHPPLGQPPRRTGRRPPWSGTHRSRPASRSTRSCFSSSRCSRHWSW